MGYIHELRKVVGNRPVIMVGATLLALNQENHLLMIKRTDNNRWGVPGGAMELGESLEDTVKREIKEEIGVDVKDLELFGVYSGQELYYKYPNGAEVYNVSVVYIIRNFNEEVIVNPDEHSEYKYFDVHNLPEEASPPIKPILRDLQARIN
ncbi:MAG: RNA pyrophosphohydrolase [Anaerolineales bacterium]|nr:RNA pyrophosphohydrolase [Anaerolineales bacterium]